LPIDGPVVTGSAVVPSKEDLCEAFLGKVSNKFQGDQIDMKWLKVATIAIRLQRMRMTELGISRVGHVVSRVEPWAELRETTEIAPRYPIIVRSTLESREYVECEGAINNVRDCGDARIRLSDATVRVKEKNLKLPRDMKALHKLNLWGKTNKN
ncbi:hypothetical protein Gohar_026644, partial [Gossypium harknessii]|nr:hypothetical protein [Gossypium harknessii]